MTSLTKLGVKARVHGGVSRERRSYGREAAGGDRRRRGSEECGRRAAWGSTEERWAVLAVDDPSASGWAIPQPYVSYGWAAQSADPCQYVSSLRQAHV